MIKMILRLRGQLECLNEDKANPVANLLDPSIETFLSSDENVDHQLLVKALTHLDRAKFV